MLPERIAASPAIHAGFLRWRAAKSEGTTLAAVRIRAWMLLEKKMVKNTQMHVIGVRNAQGIAESSSSDDE